MSAKSIIHVIDDDPAMRDSLAFLLDVNGFATRVYDSATKFFETADQQPLHCVITDVRMPGMSGLELVQKMKRESIACPVIVITGHGDVALAVEAMKAGVVDFIEKPFSDDALLNAVRLALRSAQDGGSGSTARDEAEQRLSSLSPRERDVLIGLVAGKINKVIAHELNISPRTVEVYRANLMAKTQARNMSELMRIALAAGL